MGILSIIKQSVVKTTTRWRISFRKNKTKSFEIYQSHLGKPLSICCLLFPVATWNRKILCFLIKRKICFRMVLTWIFHTIINVERDVTWFTIDQAFEVVLQQDSKREMWQENGRKMVIDYHVVAAEEHLFHTMIDMQNTPNLHKHCRLFISPCQQTWNHRLICYH